jgi:Fe-S oxidoreductase
MFKQELPLLFPEDPEVAVVSGAFYDPFEYLHLRHKSDRLKLDFKHALGTIAYHAPCHQRVQNIGPRTRDILKLIPGTTVETIERCSGHDGTYAMKREFHDVSMRIAAPVVERFGKIGADHYASDCPMAARQIHHGLKVAESPESPLSLLRHAYGV